MAGEQSEPLDWPAYHPTVHSTHIDLDSVELALKSNITFDGVVAAGKVGAGMASWVNGANNVLEFSRCPRRPAV